MLLKSVSVSQVWVFLPIFIVFAAMIKGWLIEVNLWARVSSFLSSQGIIVANMAVGLVLEDDLAVYSSDQVAYWTRWVGLHAGLEEHMLDDLIVYLGFFWSSSSLAVPNRLMVD